MDVRNLLTPGTSRDGFAALNALKASPAAAKQWGDALNQAISDRAGSADAAGINGAMRTFAQFAERNIDLNTRLRKDRNPSSLFEASKPAKDEELSPEDQKLRESAQTLVNQFFMGTMLKQMRDSPFKNDTFTGGKGGDAFAGMFDAHLSEHLGNRIAQGLVESMVKSYRKHKKNDDPDAGSGLAPKPAVAVEG